MQARRFCSMPGMPDPEDGTAGPSNDGGQEDQGGVGRPHAECKIQRDRQRPGAKGARGGQPAYYAGAGSRRSTRDAMNVSELTLGFGPAYCPVKMDGTIWHWQRWEGESTHGENKISFRAYVG